MSDVGHIDAGAIVRMLTAGNLSTLVGVSRPRHAGAVAAFFAQRCVRLPEATVRSDMLHRLFVLWCKGRRARPLSYAVFRSAVQEHGVHIVKRGFADWFVGVGLHASALEPDE